MAAAWATRHHCGEKRGCEYGRPEKAATGDHPRSSEGREGEGAAAQSQAFRPLQQVAGRRRRTSGFPRAEPWRSAYESPPWRTSTHVGDMRKPPFAEVANPARRSDRTHIAGDPVPSEVTCGRRNCWRLCADDRLVEVPGR